MCYIIKTTTNRGLIAQIIKKGKNLTTPVKNYLRTQSISACLVRDSEHEPIDEALVLVLS